MRTNLQLKLKARKIFKELKLPKNRFFNVYCMIQDGFTREQVLECIDPKLDTLQSIKMISNIRKTIINERLSKVNLNLFRPNQVEAIKKLVEFNLPEECIAFIANPKFTAEKMESLCLGFWYDFSFSKSDLFLHKMNLDKMNFIQEVVRDGYPNDIVLELVHRDINKKLFFHIKYCLDNGHSIEDILYILDSNYDLEQKHTLLYSLSLNNININFIKEYINLEMSTNSIKEVINKRGNDFWNYDVHELYTLSERLDRRNIEIKRGLDNGLSEEQISLYNQDDFNFLQMHQIYSGIRNGLSQKQLQLFSNSSIDWDKMKTIRRFLEQGYEYDDMKLLVDFDIEQIVAICSALSYPLLFEEISHFVNKKYSAKIMRNIFTLIQRRPGMDIQYFLEQNYTESQMELVLKELQSNSIDIELIKKYANPSIIAIKMQYIFEALRRNIPSDFIDEYINQDFDVSQLAEIFLGFYKNLSRNKINIYAKTYFDAFKMGVIRITLCKRVSSKLVAKIIEENPDTWVDDELFQEATWKCYTREYNENPWYFN